MLNTLKIYDKLNKNIILRSVKKEKKRMNEVVKQHNDLIDLPLRRFTASEIDILQALCYQCQEKGTTELVLEFDKLKQLADYKDKNDNHFYKAIESMGDKLFSLNIKIGTEREYEKFVLFPTYRVSEKNQKITVRVNEKFAYMLNELSGNYTALELQEAASLKSSYSKSVYRKLRRFRNTGKWITTLSEFREYLDIPASYKQSEIDRSVISIAIKELKPFFPGLKCEKYTEKKTGTRGRPKVAGYIFTFKIERKKKKTGSNQDEIAKKTGWELTPRFCPQCKRAIFKKKLSNENGDYFIYGHPDFKTGSCDYHTFDFADLLQEHQLRNENSVEETEEMKKNKKTLSERLSELFK